MGHDTQIQSALNMGDGTYDYSSCFRHVQDVISSADIAIGNLEVTLAGSPYEGYPAFSSPDELAMELKRTGFDILVNANNHAVDRRKAGLERTLDVLDSIGMVQTGVFKDAGQRSLNYPLIVEKNNIRIAFLNYTYGTNGIQVSPPNIVNYIDTSLIRNDLKKAEKALPDYIISLMHWGNEYERNESENQVALAHFLFDHGVDAIIGSHPHVVQPVRVYQGDKLAVFSLGNMISNQRKRYTDGGIMFNLSIVKGDSVTISDYSYYPAWVHKANTPRGIAFSLIHAAIDSDHHDALSITKEDAVKMQQFLNDTRSNIKGVREIPPPKLR